MKSICFSGMDGSGKSTQCQLLKKRLEGLGINSEIIHILTKGNTVASSAQDKLFLKKIYKKLKNLPTSGIGGKLKIGIATVSFLLDSWITAIYHRFKYKGKVVVYDRFFYDHLVIFGASFSKVPWWIINFARFMPKSNSTIITAVTPEVGHARKPEDSVEKLQKCAEFYRRLAYIFKIEIIDGTQSIEEIAEHIFKKQISPALGI